MAAMDDECWQLNIEELLALQSILQSSLVCFVDGIQRVIDDDTAEQLVMEGCRGRRVSCIANVHPDLPDGGLTVQVMALMDSDSGSSAELSKAAATSHVQHLPPISVVMTFHDKYPQHDPPGLQLTAEWLSKERADSLTQQLLELWKEQGPGCPVCFTWTDWLQNDALPFLCITDMLLLTFDPHALLTPESRPVPAAAGEYGLEPCQSSEQTREPAPRSKPAADSLQADGSAGLLLAHSSACLRAPGRALSPSSSHKDSGQHTEAAGASMAGRRQAARTGSPGVQASESTSRRPGRRRQTGSPQHNSARALDPKAAAWQPPDGLEATPLPESRTAQQPSHHLQETWPQRAQQGKQAMPYPAAANMPSVLVNGQAELSQESSSAHKSAEDRQNEHLENGAAELVGLGSSTAGASSTKTPGSDLDRVVQLYMHLTAYSKSRQRELFREGQHTCSICLEELPGAAFVWPGGCEHASCKTCVAQLCSLHVAEGGLENLRCPDPRCKEPFNRQCLEGLLEAEQLQRWEDLELAQSLQRMPDCVCCPRCSSACLEDAQNCAQCAKCFFAFCSLCNESWHPGIECMTAETKLELLRRRMAGMSVNVDDLRRKELEYMSLIRIQETSKRCPACGMAIQKSAGCNKMTCGNCGAFFCWRCNKEVNGYEHFHSGKCILFEHADVQRWEVEFQVQIERAQAQARNAFWGDVGGRRRSRACPSCGQANHKMNENNHMRCWACTAHFCYLCRQTLRGTKGASGSHFGKAGSGKCRQHSPD